MSAHNIILFNEIHYTFINIILGRHMGNQLENKYHKYHIFIVKPWIVNA